MKITFLGTAGSIMAKNRSFPSILVNQDLLLDCGEGTTQKLLQINKLKHIKTVCITHLHADHFLGIISLIWHYGVEKRRKRLEIIGPIGIKHTIEKILELVNTPDSIQTFQIEFTELNLSQMNQLTMGKYIIKSTPVEHGIPALAYRIEEKKKSMCYTGDTKPTKSLVLLAKNCDLLISESTLPEKFRDFTHDHFHMTPRDAAKLALETNSKQLVLVHISSHFLVYIEDFKTEAEKTFKKKVIIAEDLTELEINRNSS